MPMIRVSLFVLLMAAALAPAAAGPHRSPDQSRAREMRREGAPPLRAIQQQWRNGMPGYDYLGSDYDEYSGSYRLKFMRRGSVSWIDVDGRTGREVRRSPR
jgi:hypothetical protein